MKAAYPSRIAYDDIYGKYAKLLPSELVGQLPPGPFCEVVALACDVGHDDYALGFTKLFLRPGKGAFLEELLAMDMKVIPLLTEKIKEGATGGLRAQITHAVKGWFHKKVYQQAARGQGDRALLAQHRRPLEGQSCASWCRCHDAHKKDREAEAVARAAEERRRIAAQREQARREVLRKQQEAEAKQGGGEGQGGGRGGRGDEA